MPYSTIVDGKVLDWHFKPMSSGLQAFYIGDKYVGQVGKFRNYWVAATVKGYRVRGVFPVDGFRTRYHAAEFLLKMGGYNPKDWSDVVSDSIAVANVPGYNPPPHITDTVQEGKAMT